MAQWILAKFFFLLRVYRLRRGRVPKSRQKKKKNRGQYPAILTEQAGSIKDLLYGFRGHFSCGTQRVVPSGKR